MNGDAVTIKLSALAISPGSPLITSIRNGVSAIIFSLVFGVFQLLLNTGHSGFAQIP
jgi:hypothetical protein